MDPQRKCLDCGAPLAADDPQPVCPACIFRRLANTGSTIHPPDEARPSSSSARHRVGDPGTDFHAEYELLGEIGRGGMGVIYKAHQARLNRIVALKLIHTPGAPGEVAQRRFWAEVEVAARLSHPHIVPVYDVGVMDGCPCFSMEFFPGGSLAERLPALRDRLEQGLELLVKVARAVFFAHQHGVLHRDLKPANILLDADGEPHVADFGLAKELDSDREWTRSGAVLGSPNYMSPEQAAGKSRSLTVATDIYSLGVILYQLLTGRTPFAAGTPLETMRQLLEREPARPSSLGPRVDRDLETICLKCLEKEPERRYHSAEALADDLERWLNHEPIQARPNTTFERLWKWARRRPALAALTVALHVVFAAGLAGVLWQWRTAELARRSESRQLRRAEAALTRLELEKADDSFSNGDSKIGIGYLTRILRRDPSNHVAASRLMSVLERRPFALPTGMVFDFKGWVTTFSQSADGTLLFAGSRDRTARLLRPGDPPQELCVLNHPAGVVRAQISPDGRRAVTITDRGVVRLWSLPSGEALGEIAGDEAAADLADAEPAGEGANVAIAEFSPDGTRVLTASRAEPLRLRDANDGRLLAAPMAENQTVSAASFSPDGRWIATGEPDGTLRCWTAADFLPKGAPLGLPQRVTALTFSRSGDYVAAGDQSGLTKVWRVSDGAEVGKPRVHAKAITRIAITPDEQIVATASDDFTARTWGLLTGEPRRDPLKFVSRVKHVEFSPDGRLLLIRPLDNSLWIYESGEPRMHIEPIWETALVTEAQFTPDSARLLLATSAGRVRALDVRGGRDTEHVLPHAGEVTTVAFSPDGKRFATAGPETPARLWSLSGDRIEPEGAPLETGALRLAFSPDNSRLVGHCADGNLRSWDVAPPRPVVTNNVPALAGWELLPGPGGEAIVATCDGSIQAHHWQRAEPGKELFKTGVRIPLAVFSPDRSLMAVIGRGFEASLWSVRDGKRFSTFTNHTALLRGVDISLDNRRVVTCSVDATAQVWDAATGRLLLPPLRHKAVVLDAAFSPDGRLVATGSGDFEARIWDAQTGRSLVPPLLHKAGVLRVKFTADGTRLITAARDFTARVWDVETGLPLTTPVKHTAAVTWVDATADCLTFASASRDHTARLWRVPRALGPVPAWLLDLADAQAGFQYAEDGSAQAVSPERFLELERRIQASPARDGHTLWAKALFAGEQQATVQPKP